MCFILYCNKFILIRLNIAVTQSDIRGHLILGIEVSPEHRFYCIEVSSKHRFYCIEVSSKHRFYCIEVSSEHRFYCVEVSPEHRFYCIEVSPEHRFYCKVNFDNLSQASCDVITCIIIILSLYYHYVLSLYIIIILSLYYHYVLSLCIIIILSLCTIIVYYHLFIQIKVQFKNDMHTMNLGNIYNILLFFTQLGYWLKFNFC